MQQGNKPKCHYFKPEKPNSCRQGKACPYSHDQNRFKAQEQSHPSPKVFNAPQNHFKQEIEQPARMLGNQRAQIGDLDLKKKVTYIDRLIDGLKKECLKCQKRQHLVIISCGCQKICAACAGQIQRCPECKSPLLRNLFIA